MQTTILVRVLIESPCLINASALPESGIGPVLNVWYPTFQEFGELTKTYDDRSSFVIALGCLPKYRRGGTTNGAVLTITVIIMKPSGKQESNSRASRIPSSHKRTRLEKALSRTSTREYATETWSGT